MVRHDDQELYIELAPTSAKKLLSGELRCNNKQARADCQSIILEGVLGEGKVEIYDGGGGVLDLHCLSSHGIETAPEG